jgi:hypothetical protein
MLNPPTDLELLRIQAEVSFDGAGRLRGLHGITIANADERQSLWMGAEVPETLVAELTSVFDDAAPVVSPGEPPPALERCRRLLERGSRSLQCKAGPSFLFPEDTAFSSEAHIQRSGGGNHETLRNANPGNWHPVEWNELLDGRLGPWTMAIERGLVLSICHTPGPMNSNAAECGVWTHPGFRGRGYGAAVTWEWSALVRPSSRHLFYSTDAENLSSQRLARRLGLRPLGWLWRLAFPPARHDDGVHPLSTVHRPR